MRLTSNLAVFGLVIVTVCCGGVATPDPAKISVTITPAAATIQIGTTVAMTGDATGFTAPPGGIWWMEEAKGSPRSGYCGVSISDPTPNETDCPCGYVTYDPAKSSLPNHATYYAPSTPGMYHPTFMAMQLDGYEVVGGQTTTAAITVTP